MRAVVQRVLSASVTVHKAEVAGIGKGLLVYLGVMNEDDSEAASYIDRKISSLRVFEDNENKMNLSVIEKGYEVLLVSQFTICGNVKKGNRPSFDPAAGPEKAEKLYKYLADLLKKRNIPVQTGQFQTHMKVQSINDGPVTILIDSEKMF
ncbi:MAG: D-tyrosyl-tRNA(Tyr) deacylase [Spirochaetales bacterium]|nr:D-tyrosyl-tRNA(Tyr) deacylase [Spirochaetales bacterium]